MGIFIIKGSRLRLEDLSIRLDDEGNVETGPTTITQAIDIWPEWLQIAIEAEARPFLSGLGETPGVVAITPRARRIT